MSWNRNGKNVRNATDGLPSKIFGIMKPSKSPYLRIPRRTELVGNVYPRVLVLLNPNNMVTNCDYIA